MPISGQNARSILNKQRPDALNNTLPAHLHLGITSQGIFYFFALTGFYCAEQEATEQEAAGDWDIYDGKYHSEYQRIDDVKWIDDEPSASQVTASVRFCGAGCGSVGV